MSEKSANLSLLEKHIYNKHLAVSRSLKNKPFKIKKCFDDLPKEKKFFLKRISTFLIKHPDINLDTFFSAPYKLYPDVQYFGLDYFSSLRAIKSYTLYKKILFHQDPDSQIEDVKQSLAFITQFCIEQKIPLYQYHTHKTSNVFSWMVHYKQNKINPYVMFCFRNVFSLVQELSEDLKAFYVSAFIENFKELYTKYNNSTVLKPYLKKALPKLYIFVETQLTL